VGAAAGTAKWLIEICVEPGFSGFFWVELIGGIALCVQRGGVRRGDGEIFVSVEPTTPARLRGGDAVAGDSPGQRQQLSPGLLDLHAFDTELIPDVSPIICALFIFFFFSASVWVTSDDWDKSYCWRMLSACRICLFVTVRVMDSRNNRFYLFVELIVDLDSGCIFPGLLLGVLIRMCRVRNVKQI